jgi:hypothetical protein
MPDMFMDTTMISSVSRASVSRIRRSRCFILSENQG